MPIRGTMYSNLIMFIVFDVYKQCFFDFGCSILGDISNLYFIIRPLQRVTAFEYRATKQM